MYVEPDGDLLGIGLPDTLKKSHQAGSKMNLCGCRRLVRGGVD